MKKVILLTVLSLSLTSCVLFDAFFGIEKEVKETCPPDKTCIKSFSSYYDFEVWECIGDPITRTVEVIVSVKHNLPHQEVAFHERGFSAYDENGNGFRVKEFKFPKSSYMAMFGGFLSFDCPTGVRIKGKIILENIPPSSKEFKLIEGDVSYDNKDRNGYSMKDKGHYKIKNLIINWKK